MKWKSQRATSEGSMFPKHTPHDVQRTWTNKGGCRLQLAMNGSDTLYDITWGPVLVSAQEERVTSYLLWHYVLQHNPIFCSKAGSLVF